MADLNLYRGMGGRTMFSAPAVDQAVQMYKRGELERQAMEEEARKQELIKQSAKSAIDPATGQYDLNRHTQALEQAGFPDIAMEYRKRSLEGIGNAYRTLDAALPSANESNYPQIREQLIRGGMPAQVVPEKFDAEWLRQQHRRLGIAVKQYGDYGEVAQGPGGAKIYGQKDIDTGQLTNTREVSPPRPYASSSRGGGGGGYAPSLIEKEAEFFAETYGIPIEVALDVVRNERQGGSRMKLLQAVTQTMLSQYSTAEEAAAAAKDIVDRLYGAGASNPATFPGRPRSADTPRTPQGKRALDRSVFGATAADTVTVPLRGGGTATVPNRDARPGPTINAERITRPVEGAPPPEALRGLKPGFARPFANGQVWTVDEQGRPVRLK